MASNYKYAEGRWWLFEEKERKNYLLLLNYLSLLPPSIN